MSNIPIQDIGPECFAGQMPDGSWVICWRGENYAPQRLSLAARWNNHVRVPLVEVWRRLAERTGQ